MKFAIKHDILDLTSVTESPYRDDGWKAAIGKLLFCADPGGCCRSLPGAAATATSGSSKTVVFSLEKTSEFPWKWQYV